MWIYSHLAAVYAIRALACRRLVVGILAMTDLSRKNRPVVTAPCTVKRSAIGVSVMGPRR